MAGISSWRIRKRWTSALRSGNSVYSGMKLSLTMQRLVIWLLPALAGPMAGAIAQNAAPAGLQVKTSQGMVQGTLERTNVRSFKGIPYAAPPVGELRWKAPQPAVPWTGVRPCDHFGPRAMQPPIFSDMVF